MAKVCLNTISPGEKRERESQRFRVLSVLSWIWAKTYEYCKQTVNSKYSLVRHLPKNPMGTHGIIYFVDFQHLSTQWNFLVLGNSWRQNVFSADKCDIGDIGGRTVLFALGVEFWLLETSRYKGGQGLCFCGFLSEFLYSKTECGLWYRGDIQVGFVI